MIEQNCSIQNHTNSTGNRNDHETTTDGLEIFWRYFQIEEKYLIFSAATVLHVTSLVLIVTTAYMFVRHRFLRTAEHLVHLNLLLSDSLLLLSDWVLLAGKMMGCEIYSLSFLVFGSSSIYTAAVIAYASYEKMKNRSSHGSSLNKHPLVSVLCIWAASLLTSLFPIISKAQQLFTDDFSTGHVCYFVSGMIYARMGQPVIFLVLVILAPATVMSFCYIRIYQNVRRARITRWLNQAAHFYSAHTRIIESHPRRANVVPRKRNTSQYPMQLNTISDREKHIIIKGMFSVASQLLFWVPFSIAWLVNTNSGFSQDFVLKQIFIIILAKCSVITNICHYISFNVKFRKLYIKTLITPIQKFCCSGLRRSPRHISHISQGVSESVVIRASINSDPTIKGPNMINLPRITEVVSPRITYDREQGPPVITPKTALRSMSVPLRSNTVFPIQNSSETK